MINNKSGNISIKQAMDMMKNDNNVLLIDVKSADEYMMFHLKNSVNIPIENFNFIAPNIIKNKSQKIIIYCSTGVRSLAACELLKDLGYINVYNIYGGIDRN